MIPVFIGYDSTETAAWHVLASSLIARSSLPLALTPVGAKVLPSDIWWRPRGPKDSTEFSVARFMVPYLAGFRGWAVFMDCDMLALGDLAELWQQRDPNKAVMVVQHNHRPEHQRKFLGQEQSQYERKNWSSLMLLNCSHPACRTLTPEYVNEADGLTLHRFGWCADEDIGYIRDGWNVLKTDNRLEHPEPEAPVKLLHLTQGGPWHAVQPDTGAGELWVQALQDMLKGGNPTGLSSSIVAPGIAMVTLVYRQNPEGG